MTTPNNPDRDAAALWQRRLVHDVQHIIDNFDELNGTMCSRGCGKCIKCILTAALDARPDEEATAHAAPGDAEAKDDELAARIAFRIFAVKETIAADAQQAEQVAQNPLAGKYEWLQRLTRIIIAEFAATRAPGRGEGKGEGK
jgi:hypothetical protein